MCDGHVDRDYAGASIGGLSRLGHSFSAEYATSAPAEWGHVVPLDDAPLLLPDGAPHPFSIHYRPLESGGELSVSIDGESVSLPISAKHRAMGALFDRFGILNTHPDGHAIEIYLDDLVYSATP
jgi:hypothetical protein